MVLGIKYVLAFFLCFEGWRFNMLGIGPGLVSISPPSSNSSLRCMLLMVYCIYIGFSVYTARVLILVYVVVMCMCFFEVIVVVIIFLWMILVLSM